MNETSDPRELITLLRRIDYGVISTIGNDNKVHSSTIFYYVEDDLNFYFLTKHETYKYKNLKSNPQVSLTMTESSSLQTIQVEGVAREVDYEKTYSETMKKLMQNLKLKGIVWDELPINHIPNSGYFDFIQISPEWIRWSNFKDFGHIVHYEKKFNEK